MQLSLVFVYSLNETSVNCTVKCTNYVQLLCTSAVLILCQFALSGVLKARTPGCGMSDASVVAPSVQMGFTLSFSQVVIM